MADTLPPNSFPRNTPNPSPNSFRLINPQPQPIYPPYPPNIDRSRPTSANKYQFQVSPPQYQPQNNQSHLQVPGMHQVPPPPQNIHTHLLHPNMPQNNVTRVEHLHHPQINNHNIKHVNVPVEMIPPPPKPESKNRFEYIPYEYYYTDYEQRQILTTVAIPVQRRMMNSYQIEYITEYVPQEIDDFRMEPFQEQIIHKKIEYVPVEEEIIHIPKDVEYIIHNGQRIRNKMYGQNITSHTYLNGMPPAASRLEVHNAAQYHRNGGHIQQEIYNTRTGNINQSRRSMSRTNYVTSDGYISQFDPVHEQRIQQILSSNYEPQPPDFQRSRASQFNNQINEGGQMNGYLGSKVNQNQNPIQTSLGKGLPDFLGGMSNDYSPSKKLDGY